MAVFNYVAIDKDGKETKGKLEVNGKSIMGMLMLGADNGSEITLVTDGADAEAAFKELEAFLAKEDQ